MSDTTPSLAAVARAALDNRLGGFYVALPGRVESFDPATYRVYVQPLVRESYLDEAGEQQTEHLPVIPEVPVGLPGSGGVRVKFPISAGDEGLLVFASCSLDRWLSVGGEVDPEDDRRGSLSDAVFIPGFTGGPLGPGNASPQIEFTAGGQIHAGGSESLATKADLQAVVDQLNNHIHSGVTTGTGNSGLPLALSPAAPVSLFPSPGGTTILKGS